VENAVKGFLIKKFGGFEPAMVAGDSNWKGHRLVLLARQTDIPLSRDMELVLGTLEAYVRWAGKYPISLKCNQFTIFKQFCSGDDITPNSLNYVTLQILDGFLKQLIDEILKEFYNKWSM
jgi:hypothetical protein